MKILNKIFKRNNKNKIHEEELLKEYEMGRILQVDNGVDNKDYLTKIKEQ